MGLISEPLQPVMDALLDGETTPDQFGTDLNLSGGMMFPYPSGTVLLRRRRLDPKPERWVICGKAFPGNDTVVNDDGVTHAANASYWYSAAQVFGNGFASQWSKPVRLDFDGSSNLINPGLPMHPRDVVASPLSGGQFAVTFGYDQFGEAAPPKDFQVFGGASPAAIDFNTPLVDSVTALNYVLFDGRRNRFTFTTAAFSDGTQKSFAVRSRNVNAVSEKNTFATSAKAARATGPAVATIARLADTRGPS